MNLVNPLLIVPDYRLAIDGQDITPAINGRLINLTLTDNRGDEADTLDITLSDHDGAIMMPRHGAAISVALGWQGEALIDKGSYTVDETECSGSPDVVTIRARSLNFRDDLPGKKSRSWHRKTIADIVEQIANEHGLEPIVSESLAGIRRSDTQQTAESDISLLTRLGKDYDAIAAVKNGKLLFMPKSKAVTVSGKLMPVITLRRTDGDQHRYAFTERDAYSGVRAKWNNVSGGRHKWVIAGTGDKATELQPTYANEQYALAAATAEFARLQRGLANLTMTLVRGNPLLSPETPVICEGWKTDIDNTEWIAITVTHSLNESGLITSFEAETQQM